MAMLDEVGYDPSTFQAADGSDEESVTRRDVHRESTHVLLEEGVMDIRAHLACGIHVSFCSSLSSSARARGSETSDFPSR